MDRVKVSVQGSLFLTLWEGTKVTRERRRRAAREGGVGGESG